MSETRTIETRIEQLEANQEAYFQSQYQMQQNVNKFIENQNNSFANEKEENLWVNFYTSALNGLAGAIHISDLPKHSGLLADKSLEEFKQRFSK